MTHSDKEKCVCCDQPFPSLSELMAHMKIHHTEAEVLEAISKEEKQRVSGKAQSYM
ncbi:MAG: hypothetical protein L0154_01360 [Chloroflexi bacterium]|nr:hypothetical protein [Chloroflexota bacterium]